MLKQWLGDIVSRAVLIFTSEPIPVIAILR